MIDILFLPCLEIHLDHNCDPYQCQLDFCGLQSQPTNDGHW